MSASYLFPVVTPFPLFCEYTSHCPAPPPYPTYLAVPTLFRCFVIALLQRFILISFHYGAFRILQCLLYGRLLTIPFPSIVNRSFLAWVPLFPHSFFTLSSLSHLVLSTLGSSSPTPGFCAIASLFSSPLVWLASFFFVASPLAIYSVCPACFALFFTQPVLSSHAVASSARPLIYDVAF